MSLDQDVHGGLAPQDGPPDRLPPGISLPDGTLLTFPPSRACGCELCAAAFAAYDAGKLTLPPEDVEPEVPS